MKSLSIYVVINAVNSVNADSAISENLVLISMTFALKSELPSNKSLVGVVVINGNRLSKSSSSLPKSYHISMPTYRNGGLAASIVNGLDNLFTLSPETASMNNILSAFWSSMF